MIYDLALAKKAECSEPEKESLIPLVSLFQNFSEKARREGLLALEVELEKIENPFLKFGMQLMIDGVEPKALQDILATNIYYSESQGKDLLEKILILEGIQALSSAENSRLITSRLGMYLGRMGYELDSKQNTPSIISLYLKSVENDEPMCPNTQLLDLFFSNFDDRSIQLMLREIDQTSLAYALAGASGQIKKMVIRNMSERAALFLIEELKTVSNTVSQAIIVENQQKIETIFKNLIDMGEIV